MLYPCRPVVQATSRRKKRKKHPAEKPREHQWCHAHYNPGVFVCGRCKKAFNMRHSARTHRKTCEAKHQRNLDRFTNTITDKRSPAQKRREMRLSIGLPVYSKQGRPQHLRHVCKHCLEDLPSANKKRDHQRRCASRKKPTNK